MKNRRAKVVYSYVPQNDDELRLEVDDMIEILDEIEEGWWKGVSAKGITGVFPSNFVVEVTSDSPQINKKTDLTDKSDNDSIEGSKSTSLNRDDSLERKPKPIAKVGFGDIFAGGIKPKLSPIGDSSLEKNKNLPKKPPPPTPATETEAAPKLPPKPVREQAKVLFAYEAQNDDELTIKEGEMINIISKEIEDVGWWKGELNGRIALFPDNFVELIKSSEETNCTPRVKKPDRPTEKPPPPLNSTQPKASNLTKSDSTKSSNKTLEELPKSSIGSSSSGVSSAPVIPGKKPKVLNSSLFQSKPKPEPTQTTVPSSVKPDVVPQENGSKHDNKDIETNALRPKGPSSRRPPSTIFIPKESGNETKENGDISVLKCEINSNQSNEQLKTSSEKVEKLAPWMVELRKAQEKRKETPEDLPKERPDVRPPLQSPTKTSPNRLSGDFSNRSIQQTTEDNKSNPIQVFKPLRSTKPDITNTSVSTVNNTTVASTVTSIALTDTPVPVPTPAPSVIPTNTINTMNTITSKTTNVTNVVISSATTTTTTPTHKPEESVTNSLVDKKEVSELEKELRALKESTVSRKDFEDLVKQVTELKEVVETQKVSYSKIIKDLINDVAEERKKLATLQIEIDRLRKLTTTV